MNADRRIGVEMGAVDGGGVDRDVRATRSS